MMPYVVSYAEYDLIACEVVDEWDEEVPDLECLQVATLDTATCEQTVEERGLFDDCCDGLFPPEAYSGEGSGDVPPDPHILEYTTYDLATCTVLDRFCAFVQVCGKEESGSGSGSDSGAGSGGSGAGSGSGGVPEVDFDCAGRLIDVPETLYVRVYMDNYVTRATDPFFSQVFPAAYIGFNGATGDQEWQVAADNGISPPTPGARALSFLLQVACGGFCDGLRLRIPLGVVSGQNLGGGGVADGTDTFSGFATSFPCSGDPFDYRPIVDSSWRYWITETP